MHILKVKATQLKIDRALSKNTKSQDLGRSLQLGICAGH